MIGSSLVGCIRSILYAHLTIKLKSDQRKTVPRAVVLPTTARELIPGHRSTGRGCSIVKCICVYLHTAVTAENRTSEV